MGFDKLRFDKARFYFFNWQKGGEKLNIFDFNENPLFLRQK